MCSPRINFKLISVARCARKNHVGNLFDFGSLLFLRSLFFVFLEGFLYKMPDGFGPVVETVIKAEIINPFEQDFGKNNRDNRTLSNHVYCLPESM